MQDDSQMIPCNSACSGKTKAIRKKRLIYRLLLFVLPLLVLSVIIAGFVLSYANHTHFLKTVDRDYQNIINASAGEIRLYMENARDNLGALARLLSVAKFDAFEQQAALTAFNLKSTNFMSVRVFSREKELISSSGWARSDESSIEEDVFKTVLGGQTAVSDVMLTPEHIPYVCMGAPVFHLGKVKAVLWSELNLKAAWAVIKEINIGETGKVFITDLEGRIVADRNMIHVINATSFAGPDAVEKIKKSGKTPFSWDQEGGGGKLYCLGKMIPDTSWIIILSQTDQETYAYLYRNIYLASLVIASVSLLATLAGWYSMRKFLAPIYQLHEQVHRIGRGELDCRIEMKRQDEIGELGEAVNGMAESIRGLIQQKVETALELAHALNRAALGDAAGKVTHEVGNLLANISAICHGLKRDAPGPDVEEAIAIMETEAERVNRLIRNMLQFARKPELHLMTMPLDAVIEEVFEKHRYEIEERGIRIELDWSSDLPDIPIDFQFIYQVLYNLIKNSLEAVADPGGSIRVVGTVEGGFLRVAVQDNGPGMESEVLEKIFDPFFSTKGSTGTGLGLSICKTIVEAHGGAIECESIPGEFARFTLRLPLS